MSTTQDKFDKAKDRATEIASDAKDLAAASAKEQAEAARAQALDEMDDAASAADAARDEFEPYSLQSAALEQISAQINAVATQLRDKPIDAMVDDVAVFARKNPLLFLGGAALVGFAAARFLKSSEGAHVADYDDPWSGHLSRTETDQ
ncbi:hypothetical protein [uncultured Marivita sp.]|uniref:hypothetical protein n=1 Tax=uncultured Marivita sp. TaxID=888080 RepID=UPI00260ECE01|nr:hypothetical protein [uncultured Marivita sp.]